MVEATLKLNVVIEGDDPKTQLFQVTVLSRDKFITVRSAIRDEYQKKQQIAIYGLRLYRANLPAEQIKHTRLLEETILGVMERVASVWSSVSDVDEDLIHIIVRTTCKYLYFMAAAATPPPPETEFQKVINDFNKDQSDFVQRVRGQQGTNIGRLTSKAGLPIVLYHPVFGDFLKQLRSTHPIESQLYPHTWQYFPFSQDLCETETSDEARDSLYRLLEQVLKVKTDGVESHGALTGPNGSYLTIMEMNNQIGAGSTDPSNSSSSVVHEILERAHGMFKLPSFRQSIPFSVQAQGWLDWCCCPSILIAIAGPWMGVGQDQTRPVALDHIARVSGCIRQAQDKLRLYYSKPPAFSDKNPARAFPYLTHYTDSTGQAVHFAYQNNLCPENPEKAIFLAETIGEENPKSIVVKFVQSYNAQAHRLLAEHQLAPELLYDGTMYPEDQPESYRSMIVMKLVQGVDLTSMETSDVPRSVFDDIDRAMQLLHKHDLVFGDLREPNVMVLRDSIGKATGNAMLIDFDWCGKHGEGRYPSKIRMELVWHKDVGPGAVMDKKHDSFMETRLRRAFRVSP